MDGKQKTGCLKRMASQPFPIKIISGQAIIGTPALCRLALRITDTMKVYLFLHDNQSLWKSEGFVNQFRHN